MAKFVKLGTLSLIKLRDTFVKNYDKFLPYDIFGGRSDASVGLEIA